jgi:osmotically inducible lipoprotein OsmB
MKNLNKQVVAIFLYLLVMALSSCSGMSARDKSTAVGAGIGGVAGAVLTGGGVLGTVGGAAVGGIIGNQIEK